LGEQGERAVADWYRDRGFTVVAQNWRTRTGEIDLIATAGGLVVVCEVKTRTSDRFGAPVEALTPTKVRRLRRLAAEWLSQARAAGDIRQGLDVRFDVASVTFEHGRRSVEVLEGAF
jgi:putative endonuclease